MATALTNQTVSGAVPGTLRKQSTRTHTLCATISNLISLLIRQTQEATTCPRPHDRGPGTPYARGHTAPHTLHDHGDDGDLCRGADLLLGESDCKLLSYAYRPMAAMGAFLLLGTGSLSLQRHPKA